MASRNIGKNSTLLILILLMETTPIKLIQVKHYLTGVAIKAHQSKIVTFLDTGPYPSPDIHGPLPTAAGKVL